MVSNRDDERKGSIGHDSLQFICALYTGLNFYSNIIFIIYIYSTYIKYIYI